MPWARTDRHMTLSASNVHVCARARFLGGRMVGELSIFRLQDSYFDNGPWIVLIDKATNKLGADDAVVGNHSSLKGIHDDGFIEVRTTALVVYIYVYMNIPRKRGIKGGALFRKIICVSHGG